MKVLVLNGSPRKKGNTAEILKTIEKEITAQGHDYHEIYLATKKMNGCLACAKCKTVDDAIGCVQNDDVTEILRQMINSDAVIYASPVYFWGFSAQLKTVIDRTYSLYNYYHTPDHISLIENKRFGLLTTGGGNYEKNGELLSVAFNNVMGCYKTINAGELFIGNCSSPENLNEEAKRKAAEFVDGLVNT